MNKEKLLRVFGFVLLAGITAYGIYPFFNGTAFPMQTLNVLNRKTMLPAALFAAAAVAMDFFCWKLIYGIYNIKLRGLHGPAVFLAGFSGLLVPMKLGNIVRSEAISRKGLGDFKNSVKAEVSQLLVDASAAIVLLSTVAALRVHGVAALIAGVAAPAACFFFLRTSAEKIPFLAKLQIPPGFTTPARFFPLLAISAFSWIMEGTALFILFENLSYDAVVTDALFIVPFSALVSAISGIPGGVGISEAILSAGLGFMQVPLPMLAVVVGAFRIITFWVLIPVGWCALLLVNRIKGQSTLPE